MLPTLGGASEGGTDLSEGSGIEHSKKRCPPIVGTSYIFSFLFRLKLLADNFARYFIITKHFTMPKQPYASSKCSLSNSKTLSPLSLLGSKSEAKVISANRDEAAESVPI